jgi:hypothetical protein
MIRRLGPPRICRLCGACRPFRRGVKTMLVCGLHDKAVERDHTCDRWHDAAEGADNEMGKNGEQ